MCRPASIYSSVVQRGTDGQQQQPQGHPHSRASLVWLSNSTGLLGNLTRKHSGGELLGVTCGLWALPRCPSLAGSNVLPF